MKARFLVALILVILGVGLPVAAVKSHGLPWGFRDRAAVVVHHGGAVELFSARRATDGAPGALPIDEGTGLVSGDEVRVGVMSVAELRFADADLTLIDGARAVVDTSKIELLRGAAELDVRGDAFSLTSAIFALESALGRGRYRALTDGRERVALVVDDGVATAGAGARAEKGQMIVVARGEKPQVAALPAPPRCEIRCRVVGPGNALAEGALPQDATGLVNGAFVFGDQRGRFSVPIALDDETSAAVLFVRDVVGQTCRAVVECAP